MDEVWSAARRDAVRDGLARTGLEYADDAAAEVSKIVDRYVDGWTAARLDACRAARVQARQSASLHDLRDACLDRRLSELDAFLAALERGTPALVARAGQAASELRSVELCANTDVLTREVPPGPGQAGEVTRLRREIGEVNALALLGEVEEGQAQIGPLAQRAATLGHAPTLAEARLVQASLLDRAGSPAAAEPLAREALMASVAGRSDEVSVRAALRLAWILGRQLGRFDEAEAWLELAGATIEGIGGDVGLEATRLGYAGVIANLRGDYERAAGLHRAAFELRQTDPDLAPLRWHNLLNLGNSLLRQRRYDEAIEAMRQAQALLVEHRGPDHPDVGLVLNNIGTCLYQAERHEEARAIYEEALAHKRRTLGERHPDVASTLNNLANAVYELGDLEGAVELLRVSIEIREEALGAESFKLASPLYNLALTEQELGRHDRALAYFDRSRALYAKSQGPDAVMVGTCDLDAASSLVALGRLEEATTRYEHAVATLVLPEAAPEDRARARHELALVLLRRGKETRRARALAAEAADMCEDPEAGCDPAPMRAIAEGALPGD